MVAKSSGETIDYLLTPTLSSISRVVEYGVFTV